MDKSTEYSELRAELRQWDTTCVTVLGFLGGLWTAVYGFSDLAKNSFVLIGLSILWIIGTLYIVDKRFQIRKITLFIRTQMEENEPGPHWETWQQENEDITGRGLRFKSIEDENIKFLRFSPVQMELLLTLFVVLSNTFYLYWITYEKRLLDLAQTTTNTTRTPTETTIGWEWNLAFSILSTLVALGYGYLFYNINKVYKRAREDGKDVQGGQDGKTAV